MDIIGNLVGVLCSLLMFALGGYGLHVFMEGPKQGTEFEFNVLFVGLSPYFLFAGMLILAILIFF